MTAGRLTAQDLEPIAEAFGLGIAGRDLQVYADVFAGLGHAYDRLDELPDPSPTVAAGRPRGRPPTTGENPHGAWAWVGDIGGAGCGALKGVRVGIKDNICVAGLPMRNGSRLLDGYVPDHDATVVTRILAAGGVIAGKTVCEDLCISGGSHTSHPGPVRNPHDPRASAGGSSSGNAAAIAAGDVTMCVGGDQGGSVRTPASWCGVVGLKPTFGLVPYTGAFPIEPSVDHLGPMGRRVEDVARLLAVIAGPDGIDPRQAGIRVGDYLAAVDLPLEGLRIGVVAEGFGRPEGEDATDDAVRQALRALRAAGAVVEDVSIPWHRDASCLGVPIIVEGAVEHMLKGNAAGYGWPGLQTLDLTTAWTRGWRSRPDRLPDLAKFLLLAGEHAHRTRGGRSYAKAQALRGQLRDAYDQVLRRVDVLAMPTTPFRATPLPGPDSGLRETLLRGLDMEGNTAPFDISGHPALSVPCGLRDGLPVGLMVVGRHFDEQTVIRAGSAFERLGDWRSL